MQLDARDAGYLQDMRAAALEVSEFVRGLTFAEFSDDTRTRRAVERSTFIVGEAANHISEAVKAASPDTPWREIVGMRNILGHEYGDVRSERLWRAATNRVPGLISQLDRLLPALS